MDLDPARQVACGPPEGAAGGSAGGGARKGSGVGSGLGAPLASEPGPLKSFGSVQALCAEVRGSPGLPPDPSLLFCLDFSSCS